MPILCLLKSKSEPLRKDLLFTFSRIKIGVGATAKQPIETMTLTEKTMGSIRSGRVNAYPDLIQMISIRVTNISWLRMEHLKSCEKTKRRSAIYSLKWIPYHLSQTVG